MKALTVLVGGVLFLGAAYMARDYISRDCMKAQEYVETFQNSQVTVTKVMRGRCYLFGDK